jgi:hypothetical protein
MMRSPLRLSTLLFIAGLKRRFQQRQLTFAGTVQPLANDKAFRSFSRPLLRLNWVVYAKPPFGGPHHVLGDRARYTKMIRRDGTRKSVIPRLTSQSGRIADGQPRRESREEVYAACVARLPRCESSRTECRAARVGWYLGAPSEWKF